MTPLLEPFLYEFVEEHQRELRESAGRVGDASASGPDLPRPPLAVSAPAALCALLGWRRHSCLRKLACSHALAAR